MAAMGKDYLACTAARSGAGCTNGKSIRRSRVEEVVLDGLKSRLMAPELVAEFIGAFHQELNRKHAATRKSMGKAANVIDLSMEKSRQTGVEEAENVQASGVGDKAFDDVTDIKNEDFIYVY